MPEGSHLRDVYTLIKSDIAIIKSAIEDHYGVKIDDPVVETNE